MTQKKAVYLGWWFLWAVTAIPAAVLSIWMFGEPPMWPQFSSETTGEGTIVWLFFALWIYALPVGLVVTRRWWLDEKRV